MSTSFHLYLKSDESSSTLIPNSPSHFVTHFDNPIELQGSWRVGLQNISYSSFIKTKPAAVEICAIPTHEKTIWAKHPYQYRLSKDECWLGYDGVQPSDFEKPLTTVDTVLEALNAMNKLILCDGVKKNVFRFSRDSKTGYIIYECFDADFTLRMRTWLSEALGFEYHNIFVGDEIQKAKKPFDKSAQLTADAFHVTYFNKRLQFCEKRIMIKEKGKRVEKKDDVLTLWKETVEQHAAMTASFKSGKLVIRSKAWGTFFTASPDFSRTFAYYPTFLIGEQWAMASTSCEEDNTNQEWFIDVYSTRMAFEKDVSTRRMTVPLYPWQCKTLGEAVYRMNHKVNTHLKRVLRKDYNKSQHMFQFGIAGSDIVGKFPFTLPKNYAYLCLGQRLEVTFSENLKSLFAFHQAHCNRNLNVSIRHVGKHFDEEETLSLRCSLSEKPLSTFTHQRTDESCTNTWFDAPYFVPIKDKLITAVTCELFDSRGKLLDLHERPTMITLKCCNDS